MAFLKLIKAIKTMFIKTMFKEKNLIFLQTCGYYITVCIVFPYGK